MAHKLSGAMTGLWSFKLGSSSDDCVVIYKPTSDKIILYDIGSHDQVYYR